MHLLLPLLAFCYRCPCIWFPSLFFIPCKVFKHRIPFKKSLHTLCWLYMYNRYQELFDYCFLCPEETSDSKLIPRSYAWSLHFKTQFFYHPLQFVDYTLPWCSLPTCYFPCQSLWEQMVCESSCLGHWLFAQISASGPVLSANNPTSAGAKQ